MLAYFLSHHLLEIRRSDWLFFLKLIMFIPFIKSGCRNNVVVFEAYQVEMSTVCQLVFS